MVEKVLTAKAVGREFVRQVRYSQLASATCLQKTSSETCFRLRIKTGY